MEFQNPYRWAATAFAVCIAAGSVFRQSLESVVQTHGNVHFAVHVACFGCLTALMAKSARSSGTRWLLCFGSVLLAFGSEFYEHLQDGFPIESMDVVADCVGTGLAMVVISAVELLARFSRRTQLN